MRVHMCGAASLCPWEARIETEASSRMSPHASFHPSIHPSSQAAQLAPHGMWATAATITAAQDVASTPVPSPCFPPHSMKMRSLLRTPVPT